MSILHLKNQRDLLFEQSLVNANLIEMFTLFGLKKTEVCGKKYDLLQTGCLDSFFNIVCLPAITDLDEIENINRVFIGQKLPFCWLIDDSKISADLINNFKNDQYIFSGDIEGVFLDLTAYEDKALKSSLNITTSRIKTRKKFEEWVNIFYQSFGFHVSVAKLYFEKLSIFLENDENIFIPLGAYDGGKLVAVISLFIKDGVVGFYDGATLPAYRKKNIFSQLACYGMQIAKQQGASKAVRHTAQTSASIARNLGFQKKVNYQLYNYIGDKKV
jgi:hypothetical protein